MENIQLSEWSDQAFRTIIFDSVDAGSDAANQQLIFWLQQNAILVEQNKIHYNLIDLVPDGPEFIDTAGEVTITLYPTSGYRLPSTVQISGVQNSSYDRNTGIITISDPIEGEQIEIKAVGVFILRSQKNYLGSVGKVEAFYYDDLGNTHIAFISKTITSTDIAIQAQKTEIRSGHDGAPVFNFYSEATVSVNLSDVLWRKEYLESILGEDFSANSLECYKTTTVDFVNGKSKINDTVSPLPLYASDKSRYLVWGTKKGSDSWEVIDFDPVDNSIYIPRASGEYCIRYLGKELRAMTEEISSVIIPRELFLVITAPIFSASAGCVSAGKKTGHLTIEIPRFQIDPSCAFNSSMSSISQMSVSGQALALDDNNSCEEGQKLIRIIETIDENDWYEDVDELLVDPDTLIVGEIPICFIVLSGNKIKNIQNDDLVFTDDFLDYTTGAWAKPGQARVFIKRKPEIQTTVYIN